MTSSSVFDIIPETLDHAAAIESLHQSVFGPGRFSRTAFRVREGCPADERFSFVALKDSEFVGSVRLNAVLIGQAEAFLLGPLCVAKHVQNKGIGKALVRHALEAVRDLSPLPVILVGDAPYYAPLGFETAPLMIKMPGPVDYARLLIVWPEGCERAHYNGIMRGIRKDNPA